MTGSSITPPRGVVAMLFTGIEGATELASRLGADWPGVLAEHHRILSRAIASEGGSVEGTEGDACFATFSDPAAGARAAVAAQLALRAHAWPDPEDELRVRMGLHVGLVERNATGYTGLEVHRAARVRDAAHGAQLILTAAAREMLGDQFAADYLGAFRLKDFPAAVGLYCAVIDGLGGADFPPPRTFAARPTNLPAGLPALVGRDQDLDGIVSALTGGRDRILTLTGPGGAGKTSLALAAGARLLEEYPGGVWWIDLAQVPRPRQLLDAVASGVGADRALKLGARGAIMARFKWSGKVLLILDNLEHLGAAWSQVGDLLDSLRDLHMLCTSRMSLGIEGERVISLKGLDGAAALELIKQVVTRRGAAWSPGPEDREALADVVDLLDGLPLALELAGARLALLSPQQLRERLRTSTELLRDAGRPERQRTLGATVEWTLGLLEDGPRQLFGRLAVFAAPAALEEIQLVTGGDGLDVPEALSVLFDAALVQRVEPGDGRIRFRLPEALRQIAVQRLNASGDTDRWRLAHAERQLDLMRVGLIATVAEEMAARAALPEARAALRWGRQVRHRLSVELTVRVGEWSAAAGNLREADELLGPLADAPPDTGSLRSIMYRTLGLLAWRRGNVDEALRLIELALANADGDGAVLECVQLRGTVQLSAGRLEPALADHRRASRMARRLGPATLAAMLAMEARAMIADGDVPGAGARLAEARRVGEPVQAAGLQGLHAMEGDLAMLDGRPADALEPYARSLEAAEMREDARQIVLDLRGMANALAALGRDEQAVEVLGLADMQADEVGGNIDMSQHVFGGVSAVDALQRLDPERAARARRRGHVVVLGRRAARACELGRAAAVLLRHDA